jgi:type I restriction enzyme S subunit
MNNNIPKHWQVKKLGDVCDKLTDGSHFSPKSIPVGFPYITVKDIKKDDKIDFENCLKISSEDFNNLLKNDCRPIENDVLFSKDGTVGKVALINFDKDFVVLSSIAILRPNRFTIDSKYLFHILKSGSFLNKALDQKKGVAIRRIILRDLKEIPILIPPLPEQHQIVSKIEELLSDLDNGKQQLLTAQQQLIVYRQSLLKWAFEGKLTNKDVKDGELPELWKKVKFIDFCKLQRGHDLPLSKIEKGKYPVVTSAGINGYHNEFKANGPCLATGRSGSVGNIHYIVVDKYWPHNTVLFVKDFCGNKPKYVYYFFKQFNFKSFSASTAVPTLDRKQLYNELVPVPEIKEQQLIIDELESKLTICDKIEETIRQSLQQAETLRQSILKRAFEGKLVSL